MIFKLTLFQLSTKTKSRLEDLKSNSYNSSKNDKLMSKEPSSFENVQTSTSYLDEPHEDVVIFHRPTGQIVDVNVKSDQTQLSIFFCQREQIVDIKLSDKFKKDVINAQKRMIDPENGEEKSTVESIDELIWKEIKFDYRKLPDLYLKLSKIRLTGMLVIIYHEFPN